MSALDSELPDARTAAIEETLGRIGERISEAQALSEVCECRQGMFALAGTPASAFWAARVLSLPSG